LALVTCGIVEREENVLSTFVSEQGPISHDYRDRIVKAIYKKAEIIAQKVVFEKKEQGLTWEHRIDDLFTSRFWGFIIMLLLLGVVFWITLVGANYPSELIAHYLFRLEKTILAFLLMIKAPGWVSEILVLGTYRTLAWVISVMLPPMAIFFPLFTFLEDLGYLPRVAFNLDYLLKKCGAHGKQALTMCMGFGCNAAGITSCRIIDSPRERLIAIITNNFVPCNGRFPLLIVLTNIFWAGTFGGKAGSIISAVTVVGLVIFGVVVTFFVSFLLSRTVLKGVPSQFTLELPPFRMPQPGRIIINSIRDRTLFVLARAVVVAAPAGIIVWLMANVPVGEVTLLQGAAALLDPFARTLGLDGFILMAFILGLPANEIVLPILLMAYLSAGSMLEVGSLDGLKTLLAGNGWTSLTALNVMLFSLLHFPCSTTLLTILKETRSKKWAFLSFLIPTLVSIVVIFIVTQIARLLGLA
jgi:ferrous iron transport protein B